MFISKKLTQKAYEKAEEMLTNNIEWDFFYIGKTKVTITKGNEINQENVIYDFVLENKEFFVAML
jgi:hypothetical protein